MSEEKTKKLAAGAWQVAVRWIQSGWRLLLGVTGVCIHDWPEEDKAVGSILLLV